MNKPVLQFALLCDEVIIDGNTKKLSFIGLFEKISSNKLPIVHSKLYVVTRWINITDGVEHKQNFKIIREEDKKEIYDSKENEKPFSSTNERNYHTVVAGINNMRFDKPGSYYIDFYLDDIVQPQKIHLKVRLIKE
jgi:hypothetical protein